MKRQNRSPEARGVERQLATAKRDINTMLRSLKTLEEGGGLTPQRKVPAKFQRVPFEGGAEGLLKDIEGTTAKQLSKAFGPAIGAKQLMAQMFREFEAVVPEDLVDYAGFAAAVGMTIIYNLSVSELTITTAELKKVKQEYVTEFKAKQLVTDAVEKALAVSIASGGPASVKDAISAQLGQAAYPMAVYPFNTPYIKYMSSLVTKSLVSEKKKCTFIAKNFKTMYAYLAREPLPESVPTPNMISSAIGSAASPTTASSSVETWFKKHPEYDVDDTFEYVTRAVNAIGAGSQIHDIEELNAIRSGVSKNFARLIDAIELAGLGTKRNISEINTLKDRLLDCLKEKPSIDDIKDIKALITQAADSTPIASVEALGAYIITSIEIAELFATAAAPSTTPGAIRTGFASEIEAEEAVLYINNIHHLLDQYVNLVVTPDEADAVQEWFESNLFKKTRTGDKLRRPEVSAKFTSLANSTFKEALKDIKKYLSPLEVDASARNKTVDALNGLLIGYTSADVFSANSSNPKKIDTDTSVTLLAEVIADILNGNRLEIYDQANDDLFESTTESVQALDDIAELNLGRRDEDFINGIVLHIASLLQVRLEALLPMALQDPSIRLRGNPAMSTLHKVGLGVGAYVGTNVVTSVAQRLVNSEGATTGGKYYAAEYAPAAIVGGVGAYFIAKEKNHDVGIPLIAGAAGSVVARMAARKVDQNGALYKYFLKYAGGAWSGEMIGDKTFGASTAVAPAPLPNQADVDLYNLMTEFNTLSKKAVEKHGEDIVNQPFAQAYAAAGTAFQKVVVDPKAQTLGLNGSATPEERAAFTTAATAAIEAMKAAGLSGIPKKSKLPKHASVGRVNTDENYEEVLRERQLQENRARAAQRNASRSASQRAKKSMGKYVTSSINPPVYQYEQPVRIPDSVMEQYVEPTETGRIYSGAAGFFPTDPKVAQRMQRMPVDHEHESEPAHSNGMGRYFAQGVDMSRVNADHDPDVEEMIEHLDAADPLTSEELKREGLSGYVTSTVVRATPASAMKLEEAGVAEILKQSDSEPNTALIRVNDLGQPVSKEYNPSVAVNTGFGPHQINYAGDVADDPSGLFTRGIFSSGFPKLR